MKIIEILKSLEMIIIILISVAFITLAERKFMATMQRRIGPNIVGYYGIIQPIADGIKLFLKEILIPKLSNHFFFFLGPLITLILCLIIYIPIPLNSFSFVYESNYGILYILAISSLSVYILLYTRMIK
jgi:NADH-ubiquinone oxidoreductase chain 1